MRPTVDDEINAAWAAVNDARTERDRYRQALEEVLAFTHPQHSGGFAQRRAWNAARAALDAK